MTKQWIGQLRICSGELLEAWLLTTLTNHNLHAFYTLYSEFSALFTDLKNVCQIYEIKINQGTLFCHLFFLRGTFEGINDKTMH